MPHSRDAFLDEAMNTEKPSKLWLVSRGEYSDYGVVGVFSTQEKAKEYCLNHNGDDEKALCYGDSYRVETVELDPTLQTMKTLMQVIMRRNGEIDSIGKRRSEVDEYFRPGPSYYCHGSLDFNELCLQWYVDTEDEERAIKVVVEKRAEILAAGIWGDSDKLKAYFAAKL